MADDPTPEVWADLRANRPVAEGELVTRVATLDGQDTAVLLGMDADGDLHLLAPVAGGPTTQDIPDLNGLRVRHRITAAGDYLDVTATAPHERVFTPVCRELIHALHAEGREPWSAAATIIRQWQSAWKPTRLQMSRAVQVGLAGELLVLQRVLLPALGPAAVVQWSGPESERHDFVAGQVHLEVKTTRASRQEHEISRLDQLWRPPEGRLILVSVQLEQTIGGALTVATLIDEVLDGIRGDPAAVDDFLIKLSRLDWSDEMRRSGELIRFELREAALYEVDDDFPRLPEGFQAPNGVVAVRYTVSLANLPMIGVDEVQQAVRAAMAPT